MNKSVLIVTISIGVFLIWGGGIVHAQDRDLVQEWQNYSEILEKYYKDLVKDKDDKIKELESLNAELLEKIRSLETRLLPKKPPYIETDKTEYTMNDVIRITGAIPVEQISTDNGTKIKYSSSLSVRINNIDTHEIDSIRPVQCFVPTKHDMEYYGHMIEKDHLYDRILYGKPGFTWKTCDGLNPDGTFVKEIKIDADFKPGKHTVTIYNSGQYVPDIYFTIK